eukprot:1190740-Prorocentrum_minimum.AAC.3
MESNKWKSPSDKTPVFSRSPPLAFFSRRGGEIRRGSFLQRHDRAMPGDVYCVLARKAESVHYPKLQCTYDHVFFGDSVQLVSGSLLPTRLSLRGKLTSSPRCVEQTLMCCLKN